MEITILVVSHFQIIHLIGENSSTCLSQQSQEISRIVALPVVLGSAIPCLCYTMSSGRPKLEEDASYRRNVFEKISRLEKTQGGYIKHAVG